MKRIALLLSIVLVGVCVSPTYAQQKTKGQPKNFSPYILCREETGDLDWLNHGKQNSAIYRRANAQRNKIQLPVYANPRVKQMCSEWPGCEKWALSKYNQDSSFRIKDAEVEYYSVGMARWVWKLYIQTRESNNTHTYEFERTFDDETQSYNYLSPSRTNYFPGHPFPDSPSQHAKYNLAIDKNWNRARAKIAQRWAGVPNLSALCDKASSILEEQRVIWDKDGKPKGWKRTLQITFPNKGVSPFGTRVLFNATQKGPNGAYEYERETNSKRIIYLPDFYFLGE